MNKTSAQSILENFKPKLKKALLRVSLRERIIFIKQLAILMKAGIPLFSSLYMLEKQSRSRSLKNILKEVIKDVENGQYLAVALGKFRRVFGELTINIISIGEISGNLSSNLEHMAVHLKKQQTLRSKVLSASIYPVIIVVATLGITVMLTVFFFPKILPVLKSVNYQLPWTTRTLIFISDSFRYHSIPIIVGVVVIIVSIFLLLRNKVIHLTYDKALLYVPFASRFVQTYNVTNLCRTLGLLLNSNVGVVNAFHITANTTANLYYKKQLQYIADQLGKGEKISLQTEKNPELFPLIMSQMIQVAESTGKLSETFLYLAEMYEEEMDEIIKNLSTTLEPFLLIFMGVLVGFIAISIITPIYGITQHLTPR